MIINYSQYKSNITLLIVLIILVIVPIVDAVSLTKEEMQYSNKNQESNNVVNYYAIIIGIDYLDKLNLQKGSLSAISFYNVLLSGKNWKDENIRLLINENATKTDIQSTLLNWLDPRESTTDVVLIYFNGQTEKIPYNQNSMGNTQSYPYALQNQQNVITDIEFDSWFTELESKNLVLIFDTNYASYMSAIKKQDRCIFASTDLLFPKQNNIFQIHQKSIVAYYFEKGFQGYADQNEDSIIDSTELFSYVYNNVFEYSMNNMYLQFTLPFIQFHKPRIINKLANVKDLFKMSFGWRQLSDNGFGRNSNYATRGMAIFNGDLFIGTQNNIIPNSGNIKEQSIGLTAAASFPDFYSLLGDITRFPIRIALHLMTVASQGCEIWKYNYSENTLVKIIGKQSLSGIDAGFGSHLNAAASVMKDFNDYLYVGTWNTPIGSVLQPDRKGCEIWRSSDGIHWNQVVGHQAPFMKGGFGNPDNTGAWSIEVFNEYLYVGTMNWDFSSKGGCEVWRTKDGLHWEQVVDRGFKPFMSEINCPKKAINTYAWIMKEYNHSLYLGTFNARLWLFNEEGTGCQLWKTVDGNNWEKVFIPNGNKNESKDGFGEAENYGIRRMVVFEDELYVGIASSFFHDHGCEIWKYNEQKWTPIISDEIPGIQSTDIQYDGFGNSMNKYIWSMTVTNDNKLWVGTGNGQVYLPFVYKGEKDHRVIDSETQGCEIWCFNGDEWQPIIKNDIGLKPNGIGDSANLGARSMIEYPEDSGNIIIGTFKLFNPIPDEPLEGCELWLRYIVTDD